MFVLSETEGQITGTLCTCVATERVQPLSSLTVGGVDVTVSSSGADQDGPSTLWTLHEGQVSDGAIVHAELQVRACEP